MKKRNMASLALLGLAASFLITSQGLAHEEANVESSTEGEIARGGCGGGGGCGGSYRRPTRAERRQQGSFAPRGGEYPPPDAASCGGSALPPSGSCGGNAYPPPQGGCGGGGRSYPPAQGGCHGGYSKTPDNMQPKRAPTK